MMAGKRHFFSTAVVLLALFIVSPLAFQNCSGLSSRPESDLDSASEGLPVGTHGLMITPSGCDDQAKAFCSGGIDFARKRWGNPSISIPTTANDGAANSLQIISADPTADAVRYCLDLEYAGHSDWYLPSQIEFELIFADRNSKGLRELYWTSTSYSATTAYSQSLLPQVGSDLALTASSHKSSELLVRCVRKAR